MENENRRLEPEEFFELEKKTLGSYSDKDTQEYEKLKYGASSCTEKYFSEKKWGAFHNSLDNINHFFRQDDEGNANSEAQWILGMKRYRFQEEDNIQSPLSEPALVFTSGYNSQPRRLVTEMKEIWDLLNISGSYPYQAVSVHIPKFPVDNIEKSLDLSISCRTSYDWPDYRLFCGRNLGFDEKGIIKPQGDKDGK